MKEFVVITGYDVHRVWCESESEINTKEFENETDLGNGTIISKKVLIVVPAHMIDECESNFVIIEGKILSLDTKECWDMPDRTKKSNLK